MKNKGFIYLSIGVAALVGYAVYDYQSEVKTTEAKEANSKLLSFAPESVTEIEIENEHGKTVLKKVEDKWQVLAPVKDQADELSVSDWLEDLENERTIEVIESESQTDWPLYGLDRPKATAKVSAGSQSVFIQLGSKKNFEGNSFLRINEGPSVAVAPANIQNILSKKASDLRFKRLYRGVIADISSLELTTQKEKMWFEKKDGQWINSKALDMKMDQDKIKALVDGLYNVKAQDYMADGKPTDEQIKTLGLNSPKATLRINKSWMIKFSESAGKVATAWTSEPEYLMKIQPNEIQTYETSLTELRDRKEPFVGALGQAAKIRITVDGKTNEFVETDGNWKWTNEQPKMTFQVDKLKALIEKLKGFELTFFIDKPSHPDLKSIVQQVELLDHEGKGLIKLEIGRSSKQKFDDGSLDVAPARTNTYANAFWLKLSQVNDLALAEIIIPNP